MKKLLFALAALAVMTFGINGYIDGGSVIVKQAQAATCEHGSEADIAKRIATSAKEENLDPKVLTEVTKEQQDEIVNYFAEVIGEPAPSVPDHVWIVNWGDGTIHLIAFDANGCMDWNARVDADAQPDPEA